MRHFVFVGERRGFVRVHEFDDRLRGGASPILDEIDQIPFFRCEVQRVQGSPFTSIFFHYTEETEGKEE